MVEEAQQFNADMLERAAEKIMIKALGSKETRTFMECHQLISTGFQQAMQLVINNEAFADMSPMRKRDRDSKSPKERHGTSPKDRPRMKTESPNRKKERHSPPPRSKPYNPGTGDSGKVALQHISSYWENILSFSFIIFSKAITITIAFLLFAEMFLF
jgi:hypothetical protein